MGRQWFFWKLHIWYIYRQKSTPNFKFNSFTSLTTDTTICFITHAYNNSRTISLSNILDYTDINLQTYISVKTPDFTSTDLQIQWSTPLSTHQPTLSSILTLSRDMISLLTLHPSLESISTSTFNPSSPISSLST